jgi:uncharacterized protein (TIGR02271 family)
MNRTITAYYDSRADAERAADRLAEAGVQRTDIDIHSTDASSGTATASKGEEKGFWETLGDFFMPDEDRYAYSEGIRRGGAVLTVRAEEVEFDRLSDILEETGAVDMDTREAEWRSQGWSGYEAASMNTAAGKASDASAAATADTLTGSMTGNYASGDVSGTADDLSNRAEYIPVAEERLRVGKREVNHGRVRIRSYVRETPVEENVTLRAESVDVERRPVDRDVTSADDLFQERVIEAEEHIEEAVISKEARVVEEVRLQKNVEEHEETVRDTVRRTEVEVSDERTGRTLTDEERVRREANAE